MKETINKLSRELNLPIDVVENTYKAYWMYIKEMIESFPLKDDLDECTFNRLRLNFNIPNLGKLACTFTRYKGMKRRNKIIYDKHKVN